MLNERRNRNLVSILSTSVARFIYAVTRTKVLVAVAILLPVTLGILTAVSSAASPSSGTISAASGPLSYTAGPFIVANESGQGGVLTPVCQPNTALCDEFTLTVNANSVAATKKLLIQVQWPTSAADFDLYVLQGSTTIGSSHGSSDPESAFLNIPPDGTVSTIRVIPTTPLGDSISGTIALRDPSATTHPPPGLAPRCQNSAASH